MKRPEEIFRTVYERFMTVPSQEKEHMSTELLHHIFGSLQGLERYVSDSQAKLASVKDEARSHDLNEGARVLLEMRKTANRLQLEIARKDWQSIIRSLHIFYGMLSMARSVVVTSSPEGERRPSAH